MRLTCLLILLNLVTATAQTNPRLAPKPWASIAPFGWKPGVISEASMRQITKVKYTITVQRSWGWGKEVYSMEYDLKGGYFETSGVTFKAYGKTAPLARKGEGATEKDSLFQRRFKAGHLFKILRNIQHPSAHWSAQDFAYTGSKFQLDLSKLDRSTPKKSFTCDDCNLYSTEFQFFANETLCAKIHHVFDSMFRIPRYENSIGQEYHPKEMLEWMYLYQLNRLFVPEDIALNKTHFNEKSLAGLAKWANKQR